MGLLTEEFWKLRFAAHEVREGGIDAGHITAHDRLERGERLLDVTGAALIENLTCGPAKSQEPLSRLDGTDEGQIDITARPVAIDAHRISGFQFADAHGNADAHSRHLCG